MASLPLLFLPSLLLEALPLPSLSPRPSISSLLSVTLIPESLVAELEAVLACDLVPGWVDCYERRSRYLNQVTRPRCWLRTGSKGHMLTYQTWQLGFRRCLPSKLSPIAGMEV